jgi:quercetin dioxygenase-like cupin family protein
MIVVDSQQVEEQETKDEIVGKGPVYRKALIDPGQSGGPGVLLVSFGPGAKLNFHVHDYEQILYVTDGKGIVATKEEEVTVTPGMVIYIEPGEVHWHGATDDSSFTHLAIQKPGIRPA